MAEGRMLKRRITLSKKLSKLKTDKARLLWFYMLPFTDVDGRIEADCEDIRDEIIRKQRKGYSLGVIESCLQDLNRVKLIILYNNNGKRYLEFTRFAEEQKLRRDKEAKSQIPPPSTGQVQEQSGSTPPKDKFKLKISKDKVSKGKRRESAEEASAKRTYMEFVLLTDEEHQKLIEKFGEQGTKARIEELNNAIGSKGLKYKSHYHTILAWDIRNNKKADGQNNLKERLQRIAKEQEQQK